MGREYDDKLHQKVHGLRRLPRCVRPRGHRGLCAKANERDRRSGEAPCHYLSRHGSQQRLHASPVVLLRAVLGVAMGGGPRQAFDPTVHANRLRVRHAEGSGEQRSGLTQRLDGKPVELHVHVWVQHFLRFVFDRRVERQRCFLLLRGDSRFLRVYLPPQRNAAHRALFR